MTLMFVGCTNRKRTAPSKTLRARTLPAQRSKNLAALWIHRLRAPHPKKRPVRDLYCGRSFSDALAASQTLNASLYVISAGLGCVGSEESIPSYSLTVAGGEDNILTRATDGMTPADWWNLISDGSPFAKSLVAAVKSVGKGPILLALSGAYLKMVERDLLRLPRSKRARLRIFTATPPSGVNEQLRPFIMPYDRRLDGPDSSSPGTVSDFPSRAMLDFCLNLAARNLYKKADWHADAVRRRLRDWREPKAVRRVRKSEEELLGLVRRYRASADGVPSRLLRILRDDLGVACEQGRVKLLLAKIDRAAR